MPLGPHAGGKLNNTSDHISELVRNDCQDENQKNGSVDQASSEGRRRENRHIPRELAITHTKSTERDSPLVIASDIAKLAVH